MSDFSIFQEFFLYEFLVFSNLIFGTRERDLFFSFQIGSRESFCILDLTLFIIDVSTFVTFIQNNLFCTQRYYALTSMLVCHNLY